MTRLKVEDRALAYQGEWEVELTAAASLHSRHVSTVTGGTQAAAVWSGYIRAVDIYAAKGSGYGIAEVYVDGALHSEADLYSPEETASVRICSVSGLTDGIHRIEIRAKGDGHPSSSSDNINIDYLLPDFVPLVTPGLNRILCIGDSITFGANVTPRPGALFGRRLQQMLSLPVGIHGLSGAPIQTITNVLDAVAAPRHPGLILWVAGMNNSNPGADLEAGFDRIRELMPGTAIIASTIPFNTYYTEAQNAAKVNEVKSACIHKGVPCVDLYAATMGNAYINKPEGTVHPNGDAHILIANLFYQAILEQFGLS